MLSVPSTINVIPPTPDPFATASSAPPVAAASAVDDDEDEERFCVCAEKVALTSEWLHHHSEIFTHMTAGSTNNELRAL